MEEIPEIRESVTLRSDTLNTDLGITKGFIKNTQLKISALTKIKKITKLVNF